MQFQEKLQIAARWIRAADGMLIGAGAGMGVDSGLPDFRGKNGFWRAYPALQARGLGFHEISNASLFLDKPELAWGFYGHRLALYRSTAPHAGFGLLRRWAHAMPRGAFVYTSNVDGQFQKAGFAEEKIEECHGSLHFLQCAATCTEDVWPADAVQPLVDETRCMLVSDPPRCPRCGRVARPNVLMFSDWTWVADRAEQQRLRRQAWMAGVERLVVVELGAGRAVPTVRGMSERSGPRVIRINLHEPAIDPKKGVGLEGRALEVLQALDTLVRNGE